MRQLVERSWFLFLIALGCLMFVGTPIPGEAERKPRSAQTAKTDRAPAAETDVEDHAVIVSAAGLPACRISDEPGNVITPDVADRIGASGMPVRYTLGGAMTQTVGLPASDERLARTAAPESPAARDMGRPRVLIPLYAAMSSLQALDVVSTHRALASGGVEANPLVAPVVGSVPTMIALKTGMSGAIVYAVERLWKHNRKAAILALIGTNIGYGAIVAHNFAVAANGARTP
jgi:hypothetical protein